MCGTHKNHKEITAKDARAGWKPLSVVVFTQGARGQEILSEEEVLR